MLELERLNRERNSISISYGGRISGEPRLGGDPNTQDIIVEMVNMEISIVKMIYIVDESSIIPEYFRSYKKSSLRVSYEF